MSKDRPQPKRGNKVYLISSYCTNKDETWESLEQYVYIVDRKRRIIWQEESMTFQTGHVTNWSNKIKQRSIPALLDKWQNDYFKFDSMLKNFDLEVVELGKL